jgi:hypothetical protein
LIKMYKAPTLFSRFTLVCIFHMWLEKLFQCPEAGMRERMMNWKFTGGSAGNLHNSSDSWSRGLQDIKTANFLPWLKSCYRCDQQHPWAVNWAMQHVQPGLRWEVFWGILSLTINSTNSRIQG